MITEEKIKLNLGCRTRSMPGWKNMDCDEHDGVDIVGDISDLSSIATGSVSELYCSHVLEHMGHRRTLPVLKEWFRVLGTNGILYVAVPDFKRLVELYAELGLHDWVIQYLMGGQEYKTAYHYDLFDKTRLSRLLSEAGFKDISEVSSFPVGDKNDCSNAVSNYDLRSVSLNMVAIKI